MAETSGPWDGSLFQEDEWRLLFSAGAQLDGAIREEDVFPEGLQPTFSESNRQITFSPGYARIRGFLYRSDANIIIDVPEPSSGERIDYVALRLDPSQPVLDDRVKLVLVQGQEGANPIAPTLTQDADGIWEWPRIRIGPFGTGAIAGAPWRFMGLGLAPIQGFAGDPNDQVPGLSTIEGAVSIDTRDGKIWRYDVDDKRYNRIDAPIVGNLNPVSGWSPTENAPEGRARYWVNKEGLVHLAGAIRRTGDPALLPSSYESAGTSAGLTVIGSLPSIIRPNRMMSMIGLAETNVSPGSSPGPRTPVRVVYNANSHRLGLTHVRLTTPIQDQDDLYINTNSDVYLHGISWVIDL